LLVAFIPDVLNALDDDDDDDDDEELAGAFLFWAEDDILPLPRNTAALKMDARTRI
jgi:hypothetical protein